MISTTDILHGKVLIVDDHEANIVLLEKILRGAGYNSTDSIRQQLCEPFIFEERGVIHVKGKGDMRTWFLNSRTAKIAEKQLLPVESADNGSEVLQTGGSWKGSRALDKDFMVSENMTDMANESEQQSQHHYRASETIPTMYLKTNSGSEPYKFSLERKHVS